MLSREHGFFCEVSYLYVGMWMIPEKVSRIGLVWDRHRRYSAGYPPPILVDIDVVVLVVVLVVFVVLAVLVVVAAARAWLESG